MNRGAVLVLACLRPQREVLEVAHSSHFYPRMSTPVDGTEEGGVGYPTHDVDLSDENASIFRLLRVFLGAAVRDDEDSIPPFPNGRSASPSRAGVTAVAAATAVESPLERNPGPYVPGGGGLVEANGLALAGQPPNPKPYQRVPEWEMAMATAVARQQAGCTLWDMSADEGSASAMCSAGLVAISCTVLRHCADAASAVAKAHAGRVALAKAREPARKATDGSEAHDEDLSHVGHGSGEEGDAWNFAAEDEEAVAHAKLVCKEPPANPRVTALADEAARAEPKNLGRSQPIHSRLLGEKEPPAELALASTLNAAAEAKEAARVATAAGIPPGGEDVERLREIACGLLANVCSHRKLRQQIVGDPFLGGELLRAFHSTDDPASLTELLRLFSAAALMTATGNSSASTVADKTGCGADPRGVVENSNENEVNGCRASAAAALEARHESKDDCEGEQTAGTVDGAAPRALAVEQVLGTVEVAPAPAAASEHLVADCGVVNERHHKTDGVEKAAAGVVSNASDAAAVGLSTGLASRETLNRLAFFLRNSLEEKLLAWACSLTYSLMYQQGDAVIRPLVQEFRLEDSLAYLLNSRSSDLAYEKLGGTETGFDALLRCLEVLSTSELSAIGPFLPPAQAMPLVAETLCVAVQAAGEESQQQQLQRYEQAEKRRKVAEGGKGEASGKGMMEDAFQASTTTAPSETRGKIIRGLVAALVPWEHSRRSQRAALLVLGNVLGNALEEDVDAAGVVEEKDGAKGASESCAEELDKGLAALAAEGEGEWGTQEEEGAAAASERLAKKRREFRENIDKLVGGDDPATAADEGDGLGEELLEAVEAIAKVLDKIWRRRG